ncbi:3'-5' exoribonuclease [Arthrobacter sp. efr-133-TYG-118]|uniref:3'-5' exoribonuclease domain-containing protein n=1 Tax=Arthrobacter sp. efr-133-TYG-118 TaxID=3040279 RepID=UPI002550B352|nr:3'-5' exoribonuclease [Arthrobacter sp. efr-133-TYG-118]
MKYFYDTEFLDDGHTIEFISIGIVANDGREYYAVNADADWDRIAKHEWLMVNVVPQLPDEMEYKPKAQIRAEVTQFLLAAGQPELWAWFAAYDHVVLSQLFGRMLDLPDGIPMYTHDLRAYLDYTNIKAIPSQVEGHHDALQDARHVKVVHDYVKAHRL